MSIDQTVFDRRVRGAYDDLCMPTHQLIAMATLAERAVRTAIGEVGMKGGKTTEPIDGEDINAALFAVTHLHEMIKKFNDDYQAVYETARNEAAKPLEVVRG